MRFDNGKINVYLNLLESLLESRAEVAKIFTKKKKREKDGNHLHILQHDKKKTLRDLFHYYIIYLLNIKVTSTITKPSFFQ